MTIPTKAPLATPLLFLVFNRPDTTQQVFQEIRKARPAKLFVAADGPRQNVPGEAEKCAAVRRIATDVDWDCELTTYFREENAGCAISVSRAITWFFNEVEEGIILEDDCLPSPAFFTFCTTLLARYREDTRVMAVGGGNLLKESQRENPYSYSFSHHNNIWGWATWRRAWKFYDYHMSAYKDIEQSGFLDDQFGSDYEKQYFRWVFERTYLIPEITWDYQWEFLRRIQSGLTIFPRKNLVVNLGFGDDATHTANASNESTKLELEHLDFPLRHPEFVLPDIRGGRVGFLNHHSTFKSRVKTAIKGLLPDSIQEKLFRSGMDNLVRSHYANRHKPDLETIIDPVPVKSVFCAP